MKGTCKMKLAKKQITFAKTGRTKEDKEKNMYVFLCF